jgi:hypothetical protein
MGPVNPSLCFRFLVCKTGRHHLPVGALSFLGEHRLGLAPMAPRPQIKIMWSEGAPAETVRTLLVFVPTQDWAEPSLGTRVPQVPWTLPTHTETETQVPRHGFLSWDVGRRLSPVEPMSQMGALKPEEGTWLSHPVGTQWSWAEAPV